MNKKSHYSPDWVVSRYDEYGEKEWDRLTQNPAGEILGRHQGSGRAAAFQSAGPIPFS